MLFWNAELVSLDTADSDHNSLTVHNSLTAHLKLRLIITRSEKHKHKTCKQEAMPYSNRTHVSSCVHQVRTQYQFLQLLNKCLNNSIQWQYKCSLL